jgi:hypothetical protein
MANEFIHIDPGEILTKAEFELITGHQFNSQATGDILYASDSTQLSRLGIGSNTNVLEITGGVPAWVASSGTGSVARVTSPTFVTPALGTPSALVGTNISGTASSLTAGNVTTNANLTGHVTSSGNAAVLGSFTSAQLATALSNETGSGAAVFGTSPTLTTPALGTPASGVMTNVSGTAASLTAGTATALATARTIGGTSFDGTGNIAITTNANLTGVVTSSGNATAIADKALAIAKLADGTDGELITWNASGVIAAVAVGSADQVLTSNGSGAAPTFQAAGGGGGALIFIASATASVSSTLTITGLDSTYDSYLILLQDFDMSNDSAELNLRLGDSGGIDSGASDYNYHLTDPGSNVGTYVAVNSSNSSFIKLAGNGIGNAAGEGFGAHLILHQPGDATNRPCITGNTCAISGSGEAHLGALSASRKAVIAVTQVQVLPNLGTMTAGTMKVYGFSNS